MNFMRADKYILNRKVAAKMKPDSLVCFVLLDWSKRYENCQIGFTYPNKRINISEGIYYIDTKTTMELKI